MHTKSDSWKSLKTFYCFYTPNLTVSVLKLNIRKGNDPILKNSQRSALLSEIYISSSLRRTCLSLPTMSLKSVLGGTTMETFSPLYTRTLVPASLSWAVSTVWYENESENQRLYVAENFHLYVGQYLNTIKHVLFSQPLSWKQQWQQQSLKNIHRTRTSLWWTKISNRHSP